MDGVSTRSGVLGDAVVDTEVFIVASVMHSDESTAVTSTSLSGFLWNGNAA